MGLRTKALLMAFGVVCSQVNALRACTILPIGETQNAFADALQLRLAPVGVSEISRVQQEGDRGQYLVLGANFSLFLTSRDGLLREIGFVLSEPANDVDTEKMMQAVAYTLSHFSGNDERSLRPRLDEDLADKPLGSWNEQAGSFVAVFTKTKEGLVVKFVKVAC